jgi:N-acetylneuraminic acid mutarotase
LAGKVEGAKHPGFSKKILSYDKTLDTWAEAGEAPAALLTTGCTKWNGGIAVVNGEIRPCMRSSEGWLGREE